MDIDKARTRPRAPIRAYERLYSMDATKSAVVVHIAALKGPIDVLLKNAPRAIQATFNRHPRMRALKLRDEFATVEIVEHIDLADVEERSLLVVHDVASDPMDMSWEAFAEQEVHKTFDRCSQFPFRVTIMADETNEQAKLMLFSDHYMSDGMSGAVVIHDILEGVCSIEHGEAVTEVEKSLRPPLYDQWLESSPLQNMLRRFIIHMFGKETYKWDIEDARRAVALGEDQRDFTGVPLPDNHTSLLFATGSAASKDAMVVKCKEERVTIGGAVVAALFTTYVMDYLEHEGDPNDPFSLGIGVDYNMRPRVPDPMDADDVGFFVYSRDVDFLSKEGVQLRQTGFWDLARRCKKEVDGGLDGFSAAFGYVFADQFFHDQRSNAFYADITIPGCGLGDTSVSNLGRYPYDLEYDVGNDRKLLVDGFYFNAASRTIGTPSCFFLCCTNQMNYGMKHRYERGRGKAIFDKAVVMLESIATVTSSESVFALAERMKV